MILVTLTGNKIGRMLIAFAIMMGSVACKTKMTSKSPNIVFILIDDMGWKDPAYMGSDFYETPNIDKIAKEGIVFTNAYANAPNCAPSRACILSGQFTPRHGVFTVNSAERGSAKRRKLVPPQNKTKLSGEVVTIAEALKKEGYSTCHIGKWHMGSDDYTKPEAQGFDVNIAGDHRGHPNGYFGPFNMVNLKTHKKGEYLTDRLTDEAIKYIQKHKEEPFFLHFSHYSVHTPLQAKKRLKAKYQDKTPGHMHKHPTYAAMVESTDQSVGRILEELERLGIAENTLVVFFSDNGGYGPATSMHPLRGSKGMLYEGGIRVPLAIRWPGKIKAGRISDEPVMGIDFYPTFLSFAGAKSTGQKLDGENLSSLLFDTNPKLHRKSLFWHFPAYLEIYSGMEDSLGHWRTTPASAIRTGKWKLIEFFEDDKQELYDLLNDPGETKNIADKFPAKKKELHDELRRWRKGVNAPIPMHLNPQYENR
jgi:arylsulfatase A-like enzyme